MRTWLTGMILLSTALLVACATETPYKPADSRGEAGYTETSLGDNRYRITFVGNSSTHSETVQDYALLRAAELTLAKGYDWFETADRNEDKKVRNTTVDSGFGPTYHQSQTYYRNCDLLGNCDTVVSGRTFVTPGSGVTTTSSRASYSYSLEVLMRKNPMDDNVRSYDARRLASALRSRLIEKNRR
ncbi:MAG: hypothetical protein ACI89D_001100 [Bermanella sp.]